MGETRDARAGLRATVERVAADWWGKHANDYDEVFDRDRITPELIDALVAALADREGETARLRASLLEWPVCEDHLTVTSADFGTYDGPASEAPLWALVSLVVLYLAEATRADGVRPERPFEKGPRER